jgi:hypothetical protein
MKKVTVMIIAAVCIGCSPDFYQTVRRDNDPPLGTKPRVECYVHTKLITVLWDEDEAADEYYLYRKTSTSGDFTELVYAGRDVCYLDTDVENERYYYYELQKRRAETKFPKSDPVLGVAHLVSRDGCEDNNTKERATPFYVYNGVEANLYYCAGEKGTVLEDVDWYQVEMFPHWTYFFQVWFPEGIHEDELRFISETGEAKIIGDDNGFQLDNLDDRPAVLKFCIAANPDRFTVNGSNPVAYRIDCVRGEPRQ